MRNVESRHPAGTVGVLVGPLVRYRAVFTSLEQLKVPVGSTLVFAEGVDIAKNANLLVDSMYGDWLWVMGDDHRFDPDLLLHLLDRRVEIVAPVVCKRDPPFNPVFYKKAVVGAFDNQIYTWDLLNHEHPRGGLITVDAAGSAGMLIRRWVFESLPKPWFGYTNHVSEDVGFCLNARASGYQIHVDLDQTMTHLTTCDLEPRRDTSGQWSVIAKIGDRTAHFVGEMVTA